MVSKILLKELEIILERQLKRKPTAEEVSEHARRLVEYFELARKVNLKMPKPMLYFKKLNNIGDLKEFYAEINRN